MLPPLTFCSFLNSYWKCRRNKNWSSKHGLFSIIDVLLFPVNYSNQNMSEPDNTAQTGACTVCTHSLLWYQAKTAMAWCSTQLLFVINSPVKGLHLISVSSLVCWSLKCQKQTTKHWNVALDNFIRDNQCQNSQDTQLHVLFVEQGQYAVLRNTEAIPCYKRHWRTHSRIIPRARNSQSSCLLF